MGLFTNDNSKTKKKAKNFRDLIRKEAELGGTVFGPIPQGVRREFFCLDEHTWVWHEEWKDQNGNKKIQTTRYDIRPEGVVKCQNNGSYQKASPQETRNLIQAARKYNDLVTSQIYSKDNAIKVAA